MEFLDQLLAPAHNAITALYMSFRREALSAFATDLGRNDPKPKRVWP
jgi:hypothetical protein